MNQNPTQSKPADSEQPSGEGVVVQRLVGRLRDFAAEYAASNPPAYLQVSGQEAAKLIDWLDTAHRLIDQIEGERDRYAALLCEAMQVVYATKCHGDSTDLIDRFESLELTPCFSANANCAGTDASANQTPT